MNLKIIRYYFLLILDVCLLIAFFLFNKYGMYCTIPVLGLLYLVVLFFSMKDLCNNKSIFTSCVLIFFVIIYFYLITKIITVLSIPIIIYGLGKCDYEFFSTKTKVSYIFIFIILFSLSLLWRVYFSSSWEADTLDIVYSPNDNYRLVIVRGRDIKSSYSAVYLEKREFILLYRRLVNCEPVISERGSQFGTYYKILKGSSAKPYIYNNDYDITRIIESLIKWKNNKTLLIYNEKVNINNVHSYMKFHY